MPERPVLHVAAAVIRRGDDVALVLQGAPGEELFWSFPGGVVEDDELVPEGLAREVREESGLEVGDVRLAYLRQIDERGPVALVGGGAGAGYLVTVWVFEVESWHGELASRDPDGFVREARFVPAAEASGLLRRTPWLEVAADYLDGRLEPGSLLFERRHEDGRSERYFTDPARSPSTK